MHKKKLEDHLDENPMALRDVDVLRAALKALEQLESAGFTSGQYDLAPSFGGKTLTTPRQSLADLRNLCTR